MYHLPLCQYMREHSSKLKLQGTVSESSLLAQSSVRRTCASIYAAFPSDRTLPKSTHAYVYIFTRGDKGSCYSSYIILVIGKVWPAGLFA